MPKGTWAFLHETVIYEYMMYRFREKELRLRPIILNGKPYSKKTWFQVTSLEDIKNTFFPDVKSITIRKDLKGERPAEVKFQTSMFEYHKSKKHKSEFENFVNKNGCIIVLKHDYPPFGILSTYIIDVYELDEIDFISFVKENFVRFLNRQLKSHAYIKTWLMIQSKNFYEGDGNVLPAKLSGRWCPTDNLTGFDLSTGDKIIFVRTNGVSKQLVNTFWYNNNEVHPDWYLDELWIGRVTMPIQSREEYNLSRGLAIDSPLWYDETEIGRNDKRIMKRKTQGLRWKRVFEFAPVISLTSLRIHLQTLNSEFPEFVKALIEVYIGQGSREIDMGLYVSIIEYIANQAFRNQNQATKVSNALPFLEETTNTTIDSLTSH